MSLKAMTWAFDQMVATGPQKLLLLALANFADEDGSCWPSQETLSKMTQISERSIRNQLSALVDQELITVFRDEDDGRPYRGYRKTNRYLLTLEADVASTMRQDLPVASGNQLPVASGNLLPVEPKIQPKIQPKREKSRTSYSTSARNDLDDLDPLVQAGLQDQHQSEPTNTSEYLVWYFGQNVDSPFSRDNKRAFMRNLRLWMADGLTPSRIKLMIETYAKELKNTQRPAPTVPWKHFIACRGHLVAVTEVRAVAAERAEHANDEEYWLGTGKTVG